MATQTKQPPKKTTTRAVVKTEPKAVGRVTQMDIKKRYPQVQEIEDNMALVDLVFEKMVGPEGDKPGIDYGTVPGVTKPFCFLAGAERLALYFGLRAEKEEVEDRSDYESDMFRFRVYLNILNKNGEKIGMGFGACSSKETAYKYRWIASDQLPSDLKIGMTKVITNRDGKEIEVIDQQKWIDIHGIGSAKMTKYGLRLRILNPDTADIENTILKKAKKRSFIDGILNVTGARRKFAREEELAKPYMPTEPEDLENIELDNSEVLPSEPKPASAPTTAPTAKKETPAAGRITKDGKPTPAPSQLSSPAAQKPKERPCPIHPGAVFREYNTTNKTKVWAHKLGEKDGKSEWCFEEDALKAAATQQATLPMGTPDDMDSVDCKDSKEFLRVLYEIMERLKYDNQQLYQFIETNYPAQGTDLSKWEEVPRRALLKDLNALVKSGLKKD